MSRTNLKRVKADLQRLAEAGFDKLEAERKRDCDHINEHAQASRDQLERLDAVEKSLKDYIEQCRTVQLSAFDALLGGIASTFAEMRADENKRLAALESHAKDIATDELEIDNKPVPLKRLRAAE